MALIVFVPGILAEECEYEEIHECRLVDNKMHAFNGQLDVDCVERGIYEICTAFDYMGVEGSCYIDSDGIAKCSCKPDVGLFCSTDKLSVVVSNQDCTTRNEPCETGLYCTENTEPPYNPQCGYYSPPIINNNDGGGGGGGSGVGSADVPRPGSGDFPTTNDNPKITGEDEELTGTITDIVEGFTNPIKETFSDPKNTIYIIASAAAILAIATCILVYFKKFRKRKYKGY